MKKKLIGLALAMVFLGLALAIVFLVGCISFEIENTEKELVAKIAARHVGVEVQKEYPDIAIRIHTLCQDIVTSNNPDLIKIAINSIAVELTEEINNPLLMSDIYDLMGLINFDTVEITEFQIGIITAVAEGLISGIEM